MVNIIERLKNGKGRFIFIIGIVGILLIYLSSFIGSKEDKTTYTENSTNVYCETLEKEITELVKAVTGSRKVSVVITLDSGKQYVYADEGRTTKSDTTDDREQSYIIVRSSNGEENGLLVTEYMPTVRGAAIVCGNLTAETEEKIRAAVTAALDISNKRVFITSTTN